MGVFTAYCAAKAELTAPCNNPTDGKENIISIIQRERVWSFFKKKCPEMFDGAQDAPRGWFLMMSQHLSPCFSQAWCDIWTLKPCMKTATVSDLYTAAASQRRPSINYHNHITCTLMCMHMCRIWKMDIKHKTQHTLKGLIVFEEQIRLLVLGFAITNCLCRWRNSTQFQARNKQTIAQPTHLCERGFVSSCKSDQQSDC